MKYGNLTLGQIEAGINKIGGEEAFMRLLRDELVISEAIAKKLLERLSTTIAVPAMTQFIAKDNFVIDTSKNAKVKISYLGDNLKANFLQKVESDEVAAEELTINKLLENSFDPAIITALGGEAKVEITLGQFFAAFAKQPKGEAGTLLTNGYANVGYIRDVNGVLWAVFGRWGGDGWGFCADPLGNPDRWGVGRQFLSR
ncbi:MAG: hypothetical protein ACHQU0_01960 [Candidatus Paceibacteria bacterium]